MRHSTGKPTKAEQARFDAMKEAGVCIACHIGGHQRWAQYVEIHHLLSGNRRRGHMHTVALCLWHHQGYPDWGCTAEEMRQAIGPSLAHGSKPFRATFGTDDELLAIQNQLLANEPHPPASDSHDRY